MKLTHHEWRRYLAAIWSQTGNGTAAMPDGCGWLADLMVFPRVDDGPWRIARCLGVDKRRSLEWKDSIPESTTRPEWRWTEAKLNREDEAKARREPSTGLWSVEVWRGWGHGSQRMFLLDGFPCRDETVEALERLLGRPEYDHLFPKETLDV